MEQELYEALDRIIDKMGVAGPKIELEVPKDLAHGDLTTNVALTLAKQLEKTPKEIAENIIIEIGKTNLPMLREAQVAGPGFINFWFSRDYLLTLLQHCIKVGKEFGSSKVDVGKKIMVEFTDPNPFKEFHIGHLYNNTIGESLARLFESQRAQVMCVCYQGDVGLHVAKAVYGILQISNFQFPISNGEDLNSKTIVEKAKFLGEAYAFGAGAYEENEEAKQEINELNKKIYDRSDPELNELYDLGRKWSLEYFETIYQRLGTKFERYYFESEAGPIGMEIVRKNIGSVFKEDARAVIFPGKEHGLHNRVFINSLGLPTYEAKELGLAPTKYKDFAYDKSIIVTGNEINEYFKVLLKALSLINSDLASKTVHIGHGMVRLPEGKMSSRSGNVITGEWLLDEAKAKIRSAYPEMNEETAEMVAVGAIKYALLKNGIGGDTAFSFEDSISLSGNSGPYLQYTYARTQSLTRKAGMSNDIRSTSSGHEYQISNTTNDWKLEIGNLILEIEEENLLRLLVQFPDIVSEAAKKYAPNIVASYLFELAQMFNLFYQKHKILPTIVIPAQAGIQESDQVDSRSIDNSLEVVGNDKEVTKEQSQFRLELTAAMGQVIQNGLHLLGIQTPQKM